MGGKRDLVQHTIKLNLERPGGRKKREREREREREINCGNYFLGQMFLTLETLP